MKKGLILEIQNSKAVILKTNGEVVRVPSNDGWEAGMVVTLPARVLPLRQLATAAACFLAVAFLGLWTASVSLSPACLVSLDVNPSLEIEVNRYGKVVSVTSYNEEGAGLIQENGLLHKPLTEALNALLSGQLQNYLADSPYIAYSIQSSDSSLETKLLEQLRQTTDTFLEQAMPEADVNVDYYQADEEEVVSAHHNNMTVGKYKTLLELQALYPQLQMEDYSHCSIEEIHEEIDKCHGHSEETEGSVETSEPDEQTGSDTGDSHHTHGHDADRHE